MGRLLLLLVCLAAIALFRWPVAAPDASYAPCEPQAVILHNWQETSVSPVGLRPRR